jgi:hypothetical protein
MNDERIHKALDKRALVRRDWDDPSWRCHLLVHSASDTHDATQRRTATSGSMQDANELAMLKSAMHGP